MASCDQNLSWHRGSIPTSAQAAAGAEHKFDQRPSTVINNDSNSLWTGKNVTLLIFKYLKCMGRSYNSNLFRLDIFNHRTLYNDDFPKMMGNLHEMPVNLRRLHIVLLICPDLEHWSRDDVNSRAGDARSWHDARDTWQSPVMTSHHYPQQLTFLYR